MKIVNDDGSPVSEETASAYVDSLIRANRLRYLKSFASGLLALAKGVLPNVVTSVLVTVLVLFFLGHMTLPTGGCHFPTPTPPAPAPTDPLVQTLQSAANSDVDPKKADKLSALADYYGAAVATAKASGSVTSLSDLQSKVHAGADTVAGTGGLPNLRLAVSHYVATNLPANDGPMTDGLWANASSAYGEVSKALKQVRAN